MAILGGWRITRTGIVFVLGIIILIGLVLGGIWLVRDRGEQVRRQEALKVAEQNLESQSETETQTNTESSPAPAATETESSGTAATSGTGGASSNELPQTGADASHIIIIALLALAAGYYASSRRAVREL